MLFLKAERHRAKEQRFSGDIEERDGSIDLYSAAADSMELCGSSGTMIPHVGSKPSRSTARSI